MTRTFSNPIGMIFGVLFFGGLALLVLFVLVNSAAIVGQGVTGEQVLTDENVAYYESHAYDKHGAEATIGEKCKGIGSLFQNSTTGRNANVCFVDGVWGVYVWYQELDHEITAFIKNKMSSFDQVMQYMKNAGYELIG
jgi:prepilin-type processing-associated H-X9-DG protein